MNAQDRQLDLERALELEWLCAEFESAWQCNDADTSLENFLGRIKRLPYETALRHLLEVELDHKQRQGRSISLADYAERFPENEPLVREVFATLRASALETQETAVQEVSPSAYPSGTMLAGRFRIVSFIGRGGMGEVYRAEDSVLEHVVAVKLVTCELADAGKTKDYFLNEVRLSRQVTHPNICRVHDVGEFEGQLFLTMEFVSGEDLRSLLQRIGQFSFARGLQLARQLASGMAAAHEKGVLHRDLKPANILIDEQGQPRIADFGLATLAGPGYGSNSIVGTPKYMAPESMRGEPATIQSDIYSLGLVLREVFGRASDDPGNDLQLSTRGGSAAFDRLESILSKAVATEPSERYLSMSDLNHDLDALAGEATSLKASPPKSAIRISRRTAVITVASLMGVVAVSMARRWMNRDEAVVLMRLETGDDVTLIQPDGLSGIAWPRLTPDGKEVTYAAIGPDGKRGIYRQRLDSNIATSVGQLSNVGSPVWGPDDLIYYLQLDGHALLYPHAAQIHAIKPDGSGQRLIYPQDPTQKFDTVLAIYRSLECGLSRTGDSVRLVFSERNGPGNTRLVSITKPRSAATGRWTREALTSGNGQDYFSAISPDGSQLAYLRMNEAASSLYVLPIDRPEQRRLLHSDPERITELTWVTDRCVAFASVIAGPRELHVIDARHSRATIRKMPFGEGALAVHMQRGQCLYAKEASKGRFYIRRFDIENGVWQESEFKPFANSNAALSGVSTAESTDGAQVVIFTREKDGKRSIHRWTAEAGAVAITEELPGHTGHPRSRFGEQIVFDSRLEETDRQSAIYVVHRATKTVRRLTEGQGEINPHWSRDGEWIYYSKQTATGRQAFKRRRAGGTDSETQLTFDELGDVESAQESFNGRLYLERASGGIWSVPIDNDQKRETATLMHDAAATSRRCVVLADSIYWYSDQEQAFHVFDSATFTDTLFATVAPPRESMIWFAVSRDRKTLFYVDYDLGRIELHRREFWFPGQRRSYSSSKQSSKKP